MKENQITTLAAKGFFHNRLIKGRIEETHISWVILTVKDAFKIKKPLKLSFLDFSTVSLRRKNCEREVTLNSRFTDIYLAVLPVRYVKGKWIMGGKRGRIVDYAVHMKRMAVTKRMDNLLKQGKVDTSGVDALAGNIAAFHHKAVMISAPFDLTQARKTFNDIVSIKDVLVSLGSQYAQIIEMSVRWSNNFLRAHAKRIQQRVDRGFKRDVHGDLHSGNIFLYKNPVLFDCIEFNDQYRQIDVLYEIAFLCMDLEAFDEPRLSKVFLSAYVKRFPCFETAEDKKIFIYFKCLRANIRAKVHAMAVSQANEQSEKLYHIEAMTKYFRLIQSYIAS